MEGLSTKDMLEAKIQECIDGLNKVEKGDKKHTLLVADIKNLVNAYAQIEKMEFDEKDSDRKFLEEIRAKDLERDYRDILERDRMRNQSEMETERMRIESEIKRLDRENEAEIKRLDRESHENLERGKAVIEEKLETERIKESKRSSWRDVATKILIAGAGTGAYIILMFIGWKLECIDHGSITTVPMKELFKAIRIKIG